MSGSKFSPFYLTDESVFKTVDGLDLKAAILVPKNVKEGAKCPLMVHWHGGGYMMGDRLFEPWFALWVLQLAESRGAIIVSPNYRLLPEATADDMLNDIQDFWSWVHTDLASEVSKATARKQQVDLTKIAVSGESAGGYLSVQSALLCPNAGIKAVISQYGSLDMTIPHFSQAGEKTVMGAPHNPQANAVVDEYLEKNVRGANVTVRASTLPDTMWPLAVAYIQAGRLIEAIGSRKREQPMTLVEEAGELPATWLVHGREDSVVPLQCSTAFAEKVERVLPETPLLLSVQTGEHGFDGEVSVEQDWVQEGCEFLKPYWP